MQLRTSSDGPVASVFIKLGSTAQVRQQPQDEKQSRHRMFTSAACRKMAEAKLKAADRERDGRRANRLISAANAWLILERGIKQFELKARTARQ